MFELVQKLTSAFGVSGHEEEIRQVIQDEIRAHVDEMSVDALGNLIAIKRGSGEKIMVAAHMDEIGVMVTHIDKQGYLRVSRMGGINSFYALGQRVRFMSGLLGAVHYDEKLEDMKNLKLSTLYIDIGATSRDEAEKLVQIGDTACFVGEAFTMGDKIVSKALDDRAGCAVLIKTIQSQPTTENEIYFVFTVQEELGLRGAKTAAFGITPQMAIAVDVTMSGDTPECPPMEVKLGKGPAIKIKDASVVCHPMVKKKLEKAALENQIPVQYEILDFGGSDTGAIQISGGGIPSGAISIPCRYVHSPVETVSLEDLLNAVKLLGAAIV